MHTKKNRNEYLQKITVRFSSASIDNFVLRDVITWIVGRKTLHSKSRLCDLPRKKSERFINDYKPTIKLAWELDFGKLRDGCQKNDEIECYTLVSSIYLKKNEKVLFN